MTAQNTLTLAKLDTTLKCGDASRIEIFYQVADEETALKIFSLKRLVQDETNFENMCARLENAEEEFDLQRQNPCDDNGKILPAYTLTCGTSFQAQEYFHEGKPYSLLGMAQGLTINENKITGAWSLNDKEERVYLNDANQSLLQTKYDFYKNLESALQLQSVRSQTFSANTVAAEHKAVEKLVL